MANNKQRVNVEDRTLSISNLEKILFPDDQISKGHIIEYYVNIASVMLPHIHGRPLTLIRFPDGINDKRFFQKNKPDWTPDWVESEMLGEEEQKDYILPTETATLVWLANLASIEFHQMQVRRPAFTKPDYMAFDLDPTDNSDFKKVVEIAFHLKEHLESFGYHPFIKTSGKKGLHILLPLTAESSRKVVFEASKKLARSFIEEHPDETTLNLKKSDRKGRMLIDIYRNRSHQTIVSPYSLRATGKAPVSMPLTWDELKEVKGADHFTITNAANKVSNDGDAWKDIQQYAVALHTRRDNKKRSKKSVESDHHKSPEQLKEYSSKRDFDISPEPKGETVKGSGQRFVVQRHHATRLHYDLRLERDGELQSWAVPKGLPPRPGTKRLAVETEEHPLEYLNFEGEIPEDAYGGGTMWLFAQGTFEFLKEKKDSLRFKLESPQLQGEFKMYRTEDDQWLLEREDESNTDWLNSEIETMNAKRTSSVPGNDHLYEVKWDGIRALIALEDGEIRLRTRNQNNITAQFPELKDTSTLRATCGLFDGEIVSLDNEGRPQFERVLNRLKKSSPPKKESSSLYCYLFDCLYLDGRPIIDEPLTRRRAWIEDLIKKGGRYRLSEAFEDGKALWGAAKAQGLEGIMAKKADSTYEPGKRSSRWLKVKVQHTTDCYVIGYTKGSGSRSKHFGALHLATKDEGELQYRGKVGTGFNESSLKEINDALQMLEKTKKPVEKKIDNEKDTVWVEHKIVVEVTYGRLTEDGIFREAVFQRLRPDLSG